MKILLDTLGSDLGCKEVVAGGMLVLEKHSQVSIAFAGPKEEIEQHLGGNDFGGRVEIIDAPDTVLNTEAPVMAIKTKKESSIVKGLEALKERDDIAGLVSAGSTGGVLTGSFLKLGRISGISRPALAPLMPTKIPGKHTLLIDCGANVDCKPENLLHFALMGTAYMEALGIEKPKVALVSNGVEDKKGNELTHAAFDLIKQNENINFVGNMEARDAFTGEYDVLVCDGFVGNVLMKAAEGAFGLAFGLVKKGLTSNLISKIGALFCKKSLKKIKDQVDYEKVGGSPFLGAKQIVIKAHGSSKAKAIYYATMLAHNLAEKNITAAIEEKLVK